MKTILKIITGAYFLFSTSAYCQERARKTCTVLNIQTKGGVNLNSVQAGNLTRHILTKLDIFTVKYNQDINYIINEEELKNYKLYQEKFENKIKSKIKYDTIIKKENKRRVLNEFENTFQELRVENQKRLIAKSVYISYDCYSIQCLENIGKTLNSDLMLSGFIGVIGKTIVISFRELNVKNNTITKSKLKEFKYIPSRLNEMVTITLQDMYNQDVDKEMENLLSNNNARESKINNPYQKRLNQSGVRMGVVHIFGSNATILKAPESEGGFDASSTFFQFGYQFERQYLNQGRIQGLFEFIPTLTGLEQGMFIPSLSILHGIRDNKSGFELAFGPTFGVTTKATGYYEDGIWKLESQWAGTTPNPNLLTSRLDSRGENQFTAGFVFGIGFSLKSGNLNIPINLYTVMQKNNFRAGISFGFNTKGN